MQVRVWSDSGKLGDLLILGGGNIEAWLPRDKGITSKVMDVPTAAPSVVQTVVGGEGVEIDVLEYPSLTGADDVQVAQFMYYAQRTGLKLKMVRFRLTGGAIRIEPGTLYFMKGNLTMKSSTGGGLLKGIARKMVSGESFFVNEISGTGEVYLEPTFGHFLLHKVHANEGGLVMDKGTFYGGSAGLDISAAVQKNVSSAIFGGEGFFQTSVRGQGVIVLFSPVPWTEVHQVDLSNEKLLVDGNFALMRSERLTFRAEKSSKTWLSTAFSGEGLLQTFEGTGTVWLAPTQGVYEKAKQNAGFSSHAGATAQMRTQVAPKP